VPPGAAVAGSPAFDAAQWRRAVTAFPKLPEMLRTMRELKRRLEELERQIAGGQAEATSQEG
jgi:UDP-3-O-[3-hydroxymyristoyl] glucosamine N-acyltransferase